MMTPVESRRYGFMVRDFTNEQVKAYNDHLLAGKRAEDFFAKMEKHLAGQHDQTTHGSWSGSPKLTILDEKGSENEFLNESLRVVRYEEKGKKPVDYVLFADGEYKIIVAPKPTDGTNFTGSSGIERKGVGALIAEGPKASHLRLTSGLDNYFTVNEIAVKPRHQRRGLASAMLQFHRDMYPEANIQHSDALTQDGKSWATVVKHLAGQHDQESHGSWSTGLPEGTKFQSQDRVKIKGDENIWSINFSQGNGVYLINRHDDKYTGRNKAWKFIKKDVNESEMTLVEQGKMSRLLYGEFVQKHLAGQHDQKSHGVRGLSPSVASDIVRFTQEWGGLSINMVDGSMPTTGYMVAKPPEFSRIVDEVDFSNPVKGPRILSDYMKTHKNDLGNGKNYLGTWLNDSKVYLDVSENIQELFEAIRRGRERNQKAIWDVANLSEIDTGGTGLVKERNQDSRVEEHLGNDRRRDRRIRTANLERSSGEEKLTVFVKPPVEKRD